VAVAGDTVARMPITFQLVTAAHASYPKLLSVRCSCGERVTYVTSLLKGLGYSDIRVDGVLVAEPNGVPAQH
jgi:hypothetical protein